MTHGWRGWYGKLDFDPLGVHGGQGSFQLLPRHHDVDGGKGVHNLLHTCTGAVSRPASARHVCAQGATERFCMGMSCRWTRTGVCAGGPGAKARIMSAMGHLALRGSADGARPSPRWGRGGAGGGHGFTLSNLAPQDGPLYDFGGLRSAMTPANPRPEEGP